MNSKFRRIQHLLTALPVLEAAARYGSFTKAGDELGLSQPTVSRHIANLEADLGVSLFTRNHNQLTVTKLGRRLANAVNLGFAHIDGEVRNTAVETRKKGITLACTQTFANCWLLPRFSELRRASGDKPIHLVASYWLEDVNIDEVDIIAHWHPESWAGWPLIHLFDEIVFPVCSPDYLARHPYLNGTIENPATLLDAQLLHYDERELEFVGWQNWFSNFGCVYRPENTDLRFANYQFALQAAMDGEGIALAWQHLVSDHLVQGDLLEIGPRFRRPEAAYVLEYRDDRRTPDHLGLVIDWFRDMAAE